MRRFLVSLILACVLSLALNALNDVLVCHAIQGCSLTWKYPR